MHTNRLYYEDAYLTRFFTARIVDHIEIDGRSASGAGDRTAFIPTGGGQPCDTGTLNGVPVERYARRVSSCGDIVDQPIDFENGRRLHRLATA